MTFEPQFGESISSVFLVKPGRCGGCYFITLVWININLIPHENGNVLTCRIWKKMKKLLRYLPEVGESDTFHYFIKNLDDFEFDGRRLFKRKLEHE